MGMGVGLSFWGGLKATVWFLFFAFLRSFGFALLSLPFLYASLVSLLVSLASHPSINLPQLLGKNPDGSLPIWSIIIFSPYLYFARGFSAIRRLRSGEAPYSEICEGVYVGGWPSSLDKLPPGDPAIVDCTCEFPRRPELRGHEYFCFPTWDTRSPGPGEIESAVKWAGGKRARNRPVFIHCAHGHGRSVAVSCALLVALGVAEDWKNAERIFKERRPYIRMNTLHRRMVEAPAFFSQEERRTRRNETRDLFRRIQPFLIRHVRRHGDKNSSSGYFSGDFVLPWNLISGSYRFSNYVGNKRSCCWSGSVVLSITTELRV